MDRASESLSIINEESTQSLQFKLEEWGNFPGGLVVGNLPSNAGNVGSIPGSGTKISLVGQLNLHATTREPTHCSEDPAQPKF